MSSTSSSTTIQAKSSSESYNWDEEIENAQKGLSGSTTIKYSFYKISLCYNQALFGTSLGIWLRQNTSLGRLIASEAVWWNEIPLPHATTSAKLYLGALPVKSDFSSRDDLQELKKLGVRAVLSINELFETQETGKIIRPVHHDEWKKAGIKHLQIISPDFSTIEASKLNKAMAFIEYCLTNNLSTYVHCKAGKGRSALTVVCYLMKYQHMKAADAHGLVKKQRPQIAINKRQFKTIEALEKQLHAG